MEKKLSFLIFKDDYAEPHNRFVLCVKLDCKTVLAPRYASLAEALCAINELIKEYAPKQERVEIVITTD